MNGTRERTVTGMAEYIERDAAINAFYTATADGDKADWCVGVLQSLRAASVRENVKGKWNADKESPEYATCSVCGHCDWDCTESEYFNFCPNCGADMTGGNDART